MPCQKSSRSLRPALLSYSPDGSQSMSVTGSQPECIHAYVSDYHHPGVIRRLIIIMVSPNNHAGSSKRRFALATRGQNSRCHLYLATGCQKHRNTVSSSQDAYKRHRRSPHTYTADYANRLHQGLSTVSDELLALHASVIPRGARLCNPCCSFANASRDSRLSAS